jgi:TorA maturation chaperone TorD
MSNRPEHVHTMSSTATTGNDANSETFSEAALRSGSYALLAALLRSPPQQELLDHLQGIQAEADEQTDNGNSSDQIGTAWLGLRQAAQTADLQRLDDEYHRLFIGIGRGELVPYGSWYLTGFLMEKPLGELRRDLAQLGYERQENVHEPEDHVAALCEVMALLISDAGVSISSDIPPKFFETHMSSWIETFFSDLEQTAATDFYQAAGRLGRAFIRLEKQYLSMPV